MKTVDIVVPCYNEEEVIDLFLAETDKVLRDIEGYSFRYLMVDDGSGDSTLAKLKAIAAQRPDVKFIAFSRNFGKEAAMYAGLRHVSADYAIIMDADLQHPPALIPQMVEGVREGYDCCAAMRDTRTGEGKVRSFFSQSFYKISNKLTSVKMPYGAVDFRIMSRQMVDAVLSLAEVQRFSKGIFAWVGYDTKWITYHNVERAAGKTKWSFWGLMKYAIDGITAFSSVPLRVISVLGFVISLFAFLYSLVVIIQALFFGVDVPGYVTTLCATLFMGGVIELSVGILGEYISRIYMESKRRPVYLLKSTNIDAEESPSKQENG